MSKFIDESDLVDLLIINSKNKHKKESEIEYLQLEIPEYIPPSKPIDESSDTSDIIVIQF